MKWLLILLTIIFTILLLTPVEFKFFYVFKDGKSSLKISTSYLFGLFKPEFQPFDGENKEKEKRIDDQFKNNSERFQKLKEYKEIFHYIIRRIVVKELKWDTKIGLSESYYLSILYGFLWWIKSLIIGYLLSKKEIENIKINILPIYNKNVIGSQLNCIIKIRMVYIINIWIWLIKLYKGGEKNDRPSNRRLNENYNE